MRSTVLKRKNGVWQEAARAPPAVVRPVWAGCSTTHNAHNPWGVQPVAFHWSRLLAVILGGQSPVGQVPQAWPQAWPGAAAGGWAWPQATVGVAESVVSLRRCAGVAWFALAQLELSPGATARRYLPVVGRAAGLQDGFATPPAESNSVSPVDGRAVLCLWCRARPCHFARPALGRSGVEVMCSLRVRSCALPCLLL
jgi:hypothetical protein